MIFKMSFRYDEQIDKKMNEIDIVKYQNLFKSPNYENYERAAGEAKSGPYKYKRDHPNAIVDGFLKKI